MRRDELSRRDWIRRCAITGMGFALPIGVDLRVDAAADSDPKKVAALGASDVFKEYRYGHTLQEYYVHRLREISRRRAEERSAIQTPGQVLRLRDDVRRKLKVCYGSLPERTPLRARITGKVERDDYSIEKLIYESRPGYLVTANVYVPKNRTGRLPAVLAPCGHSSNGKASATYQEFSRNLARQGYVVLIYDPPSQGERLEYPDRPGERSIRYGVTSHNVAGNQMSLCGRSFALWEAWDGIRGLDYLLTRPDVDPGRIGLTGNSGGGTQTSHLSALDSRFTMTAPSCFVTRFRYNLENEEPTDAEQIVPGMLAEGLDMADFFIAHIPRPLLLVGQVNDFFDVRGLRETYQELRRLYSILGLEKNIGLHVGPNTHGYHKDGREAMYRFFNQQAGVHAKPEEPTRPLEPDEVLRVTEGGQTHLIGSRRSFDFTRDRASELAAQRAPLEGEALAGAIRTRLALPGRSGAPRYRVLRHRTVWRDPRIDDHGFIVETEARSVAMLHAIPDSGSLYHFPEGREASLYVPHRSSLKEIILGQAPASEGVPVRFAIDVRGMGEVTARTQKDRGDDFFASYGTDYMYANHGLMLNESYAGRRVHDLLSVLDLFQDHGYEKVHLVGRGMGSITTMFAAVLHPIVHRVTLHEALLSYHELTQDPRYTWPLSGMVYGILEQFDLPDCLRALSDSKGLTLVDPRDSRMRPWSAVPLKSHLTRLGLEGVTIRST